MKISVEYLGHNVKQTFTVLTKKFWDDSLIPLPSDKSIGEAKERRHQELKKFEPYIIDHSSIYASISTGEIVLPFVPILTSHKRILVKTVIL